MIEDGDERTIDPGNLFNAKEGKVSPLVPSEMEMIILELDELQRLAEMLTPAPMPDEN